MSDMKEPFHGDKLKWMDLVKQRWPKSKFEDAGGGRWFAVSDQVDLAFYSIVQGGGWIRELGYAANARILGRLLTEDELRNRSRGYEQAMAIPQKLLLEAADRAKSSKWLPRSKYSMSVGALIYANDTGKFLLGKRGPTIEDPNVWGTFGGGVDEGESLAGALARELFEEAGYSGPMTLQPLYVYYDRGTGFRYFNHLAIVPKQFDPVLNFETSEVSWFDWGHHPNPLHPGVQNLFNDPASRIVIESVLDNKPVRGNT